MPLKSKIEQIPILTEIKDLKELLELIVNGKHYIIGNDRDIQAYAREKLCILNGPNYTYLASDQVTTETNNFFDHINNSFVKNVRPKRRGDNTTGETPWKRQKVYQADTDPMKSLVNNMAGLFLKRKISHTYDGDKKAKRACYTPGT